MAIFIADYALLIQINTVQSINFRFSPCIF